MCNFMKYFYETIFKSIFPTFQTSLRTMKWMSSSTKLDLLSSIEILIIALNHPSTCSKPRNNWIFGEDIPMKLKK